MLPFVAWGVLADFLKNVAITAPPLVASQTGFGALGARYHRVRLPVRLADPADRRAGGRLGADAPRVPRAHACARARRVTRQPASTYVTKGKPRAADHRRWSWSRSRTSALAFVSKAVAYAPADAWTVWLASGVVFGALLARAARRAGRPCSPAASSARRCSRSTLGVDVVDALGYGVDRGRRRRRRGAASCRSLCRCRSRSTAPRELAAMICARRAAARARSAALLATAWHVAHRRQRRPARRSASGCCRTSSARCSWRR